MALRKFLVVRSLPTSPAPGRRKGRLRRSLEGGAALIRLAERIEQWRQMARIIAPAPDRAVIERLSHLPAAGRRDRPLGAVKIEASRLPSRPRNAIRRRLSPWGRRPAPRIRLEHLQRQHPAPVLGKALGFEIPLRAIGEVVREMSWPRANSGNNRRDRCRADRAGRRRRAAPGTMSR